MSADVRHHPGDAEGVLAVSPDDDLLIYRTENAVRFQRGGESRAVALASDLLGFDASPAFSSVALLVRRPSSDSLLLRGFRSNGAHRFDVVVPHHWDDPLPRIAIADQAGEAVYTRRERAEVVFLNADGSLQRQASLFDEVEHDLERNVLVDFSPDGRFVAVAAQQRGAQLELPQAEANTHLFLFDAGGTLLWTRALPEPGLQTLSFASEARIAVSTFDAYSAGGVGHRSRLFALDGSQTFEAPFGAESFHFDSGGVLLVTKKSVSAFALTGGPPRFTYRPPPEMQIMSASAAGARHALLVGRATVTADGFMAEDLRLIHADENGAVLEDRGLDVATARAPIVTLSPGQRSTMLVLDETRHCFRWP